MFRRFVLPLLLVSLAAVPLSAQIASGSFGPSGTIGGPVDVGGSDRNQPYTVTQQTTTIRTLADGTHITVVREETRIRDAEGRVRTEMTRDGSFPVSMHFVQIFDPVNHTVTTLDQRNKQAHVNHMPEPKPLTPEEKARFAEMRAKAKSADTASGAQSAPAVPRTHRDSEVLAPRVIAGVNAEGRRVTRVIPAGKEGNDRDLTTVTETWNSPELHVMLERTSDDPRSGKSTMITTSLERSSPDPALFQIPPDYKVIDQQPFSSQ